MQNKKTFMQKLLQKNRNLVSENETLKRRIGELSESYQGQIKILQSVIDEANAQEPWCLVGDGQMFFNDQDMIDHFDGGYFDKSTFTKLYTNPIPAQQSPAVEVPYAFEFYAKYNGRWTPQIEHADTFGLGKTVYDFDYRKIKPLYEHPSPRITEQDAREIAYSALCSVSYDSEVYISEWMASKCPLLLDKLNGAKNGK